MTLLDQLTVLLQQAKKKEVDLSFEPIYPKVSSWDQWCSERQAAPETRLEGYAVLSSLCFVKTTHLLPPLPEAAKEEQEEEEETLDMNVLNHLYENLNQAKQFLQEKQKEMEPLYARTGALVLDDELFELEDRLQPVPFSKLLEQLAAFLKEQQPEIPSIPSPMISLEEKMEEVWQKLSHTQEGVSFLAIVGDRLNRAAIIVSFLAVLELMRLGRIKAFQKAFGQEIFLYPSDKAA